FQSLTHTVHSTLQTPGYEARHSIAQGLDHTYFCPLLSGLLCASPGRLLTMHLSTGFVATIILAPAPLHPPPDKHRFESGYSEFFRRKEFAGGIPLAAFHT